MDPNKVQELTEILDEFLDNPKDKELIDEYVKMLKERSVYSFLSVLYRIQYPRIHLLLNVTNDLVKIRVGKLVIQTNTSIDSSTTDTESQSSPSGESSSSSSEEEAGPSCRTGSMFDVLMDED